MHQYLKAIGFENIQTRKELKKILKHKKNRQITKKIINAHLEFVKFYFHFLAYKNK